MSVVLRVQTHSGSTYVMTDSGRMTCTRVAGHPLGEREVAQVTALQLIGRLGDLRLAVRTADGGFRTSRLVTGGTLPAGMRKPGHTWTVAHQPALRPLEPLRSLTVVPQGVAAAMAVHAD